MTPASNAFQVSCALSAFADSPLLRIADVHSNAVSKRQMWHLLGVKELNAQLQAAVSENELYLRRQEEQHGMDLKDFISRLKPNLLQFGSHAVGSQYTVKVGTLLLMRETQCLVFQPKYRPDHPKSTYLHYMILCF